MSSFIFEYFPKDDRAFHSDSDNNDASILAYRSDFHYTDLTYTVSYLYQHFISFELQDEKKSLIDSDQIIVDSINFRYSDMYEKIQVTLNQISDINDKNENKYSPIFQKKNHYHIKKR